MNKNIVSILIATTFVLSLFVNTVNPVFAASNTVVNNMVTQQTTQKMPDKVLSVELFPQPIIKDSPQVYMAVKSGATVINAKGDKNLEVGSFVAVNERNYSTDAKGTLITDSTVLQVPQSMSSSFYYEFTGNEMKIKLYASPLDDSQFEEVYSIDTLMTRDMNIYNTHFISYMYNGVLRYIDTNSITLKTKTTRNYVPVSRGGVNDKIFLVAKRNHINLSAQSKSGLSVEELSFITYGTELEGIEYAVKYVEDTYGINSLFTISTAAHESGWGKSYLARTRNNLFGIAAYDGDEGAAYHFKTKADCVVYWGELIHDNYFASGLTTPEAINTIYASDHSWSTKIENTMANCANKLIN